MLQRHLGPCISVAPVSCPFIFLTCFVPKPTRKSNHIMTWSLHQKPLGHVPKSFRLLECNQRDVWCPSADLDFVKPRLRTAITWKIEVIFFHTWVEPLASSLHMPRRRHQEHGSLEPSIRMLGTHTIEHRC